MSSPNPPSPVHASASTTTLWETFHLGPFCLPRLWVGLWQLSSTAWGSAPASKIREAMARHVDQGYTAFGKEIVRKKTRLRFSFADLALCEQLTDMVNLLRARLFVVLTDVIAPHNFIAKGERVSIEPYIQTLIFLFLSQPADHYGPAEIVFVSCWPHLALGTPLLTPVTGTVPGASPTPHCPRSHQMVSLQTQRRTFSLHRRGRCPRAHDTHAH